MNNDIDEIYKEMFDDLCYLKITTNLIIFKNRFN